MKVPGKVGSEDKVMVAAIEAGADDVESDENDHCEGIENGLRLIRKLVEFSRS